MPFNIERAFEQNKVWCAGGDFAIGDVAAEGGGGGGEEVGELHLLIVRRVENFGERQDWGQDVMCGSECQSVRAQRINPVQADFWYYDIGKG